MPDPTTGTDSTPGATTPPEGTAAPSNDQTSTSAGEAGTQTTPQGFSEEFLKQLDEVIADPTRLPQERREKLEAPFKSDYTKKTQELAEERRNFEVERKTTFDAVRKIIEARGAAPAGPSPQEERIKELRDLAVAGDAAALEQLAEIKAQQLVQPIQTQMALRNAAETAMAFSPYVKNNWNQILQTIEADPKLSSLAKADGYKYADTVMIGLGLEREVMDLRPKVGTLAKELEAAKAKIASLEKERTASLPASTSRAGTTSGAPGAERPTDPVGLAQMAWVASGHRLEDFK